MHPLSEPSHASVAARALKDPENRSIEIGVVCTLLFHVLLVTVAPRLPVELLHGASVPTAGTSAGKDFNIELAPDAFEAKVDPFRFVETNPDAPENEPDQTANFSNRNQQTAQAERAAELDPENRPSVKGQDTIKSDAIVSGEDAEQQTGTFTITTNPQAAEAAAAEQAARAEQVPLPGTEKFEGESPDSIGSNISEAKSPTTNAEEHVEGITGARGTAGSTSTAAQDATPRTPAPRPRLHESSARSTILTNRIAGTYNVGVLGIDARWSEYGDYMNELIGIVNAQWKKLLAARTTYPPTGTHAVIKFKLNSEGVTEIVSVEDTCGTVGVQISLSSIRDREPYRKWSDQMIAVLGKEQTLEFGFYFR